MSPSEHNEYWINHFTKKLRSVSEYSYDWYLLRKRLAEQVREWRKTNTLKAV